MIKNIQELFIIVNKAVTCVFIASKLEEVYPMTLEILLIYAIFYIKEEFLHLNYQIENLFTRDSIIMMEEAISVEYLSYYSKFYSIKWWMDFLLL